MSARTDSDHPDMTHRLPDLSSPPYADYEYPRKTPGLFSRICPSAFFYMRVARAVFSSASLARKGRFGDYEWWLGSRQVRDAFEKTGAHISIRGTANFALMKDPCVFIGNHMSTAETFLAATMILPLRPVTFVVKESLMEYPVFKHIMRSRDPVVVGRQNPREDLKAVMDGGQERLRKGISIIIFPQRTRTVQFDREGFNSIGAKLARRSGVPVVPLALKTNAWSNGKFLKDFGRFHPEEDVVFEFGEPIMDTSDDKSVHRTVVNFIEDRLRTWGL